ncbi:MAG: YbaK/EbsC family protein [Porticoccus sp.]|nr:YbaK/EbsC family protein [Porticoccus sp.]MBQ0807530.1 YbaK/EbsC family protein [Porticoccus sp.]
MSISPAVANYLSQKNVNYEVIEHAGTSSSLATARAAHVPADKLAKAVVVKRGNDYAMCVIPASNQLVLEWLKYGRQHEYEIASEDELTGLFSGCEEGAIPGLGEAFKMDVIIDNELLELKDVYVEGGDHSHLLHISHRDFNRLMVNAWVAPISCQKGGQDDHLYL